MGFIAVTGRAGQVSKKARAWVSVNTNMGTVTLSCSIRNAEMYEALAGKEFTLQIGTEEDKGSFALVQGKGRTIKAGERFANATYMAAKLVKAIFGEEGVTRAPADVIQLEGGAVLFVMRPVAQPDPEVDVVIDSEGEHEAAPTEGVDPVSAAVAPAKKAKKK